MGGPGLVEPAVPDYHHFMRVHAAAMPLLSCLARREVWIVGYQNDMRALDAAGRAASSAGGQILRTATGAIAARPAAKPLHPRGSVVGATLSRFGADVGSGVAWLDQVQDEEVLVRQSRSVGLPAVVPDIVGLAVRVPTPGGRHGDLLFASTGLGRVTRYMLIPGRSPYARPLTTLLPYRTSAGPMLLSTVFVDETLLRLSWAVGSGAWHPFATLALDRPPVDEPDPLISFDPVANVLPGLETYEWVRRLRAPAYDTARRSRAAGGP